MSHKEPWQLPRGWTWATVADLGEVNLGRQRSPKNRSNQYPTKYIRAANITWKGLDLADVLEMDFKPQEREKYRLLPGDIVLSEASGSPDEVGKPAIWRSQLDECCFQNTVIRFRPYTGCPEYFLELFRCYALTGRFAAVAHGVGIHHLGAERFAAIPMPVAPLAEQRRIVAEVDRRLSLIGELEAVLAANLKRAGRLRQATLKGAFDGNLVPQDPSDEPASVLLERIRQQQARAERDAILRRRAPGSRKSP